MNNHRIAIFIAGGLAAFALGAETANWGLGPMTTALDKTAPHAAASDEALANASPGDWRPMQAMAVADPQIVRLSAPNSRDRVSGADIGGEGARPDSRQTDDAPASGELSDDRGSSLGAIAEDVASDPAPWLDGPPRQDDAKGERQLRADGSQPVGRPN